MVEGGISAEDKAAVTARLALLAPPCEFSEVLEDVRAISCENPSAHKKLASAAAQYNRDQMIPVMLPNADHHSLVSTHGDLGGGYFLCPRTHTAFHYDHLQGVVGEIKSLAVDDSDGGNVAAEPWRKAVETALTDYTIEHFPGGSVAVYAPAFKNGEHRLIICIESHFRKHQSTGRWRSEWTVTLPDDLADGQFSVHGILKVQTHLFEEGNVQLISSKEIDFSGTASSPKDVANTCAKKIKEADITYQTAVGENFQTMSDTTFKALRRQLPLTRSKIDWNKIITYQIGSELPRAP